MPERAEVVRAELVEVDFDSQYRVSRTGESVRVQFNPETLRLSYSVTSQSRGAPAGGATQFVSQGTTRLSVELLFDVTAPDATANDVRELTQPVLRFVEPVASGRNFRLRGLRFRWGAMTYDGRVETATENLELFSADGRPLRATIGLEISRQQVRIATPPPSNDPSQPQEPTRAGEAAPQVAARLGDASNWRPVADAMGAESARRLPAGFVPRGLPSAASLTAGVRLPRV